MNVLKANHADSGTDFPWIRVCGCRGLKGSEGDEDARECPAPYVKMHGPFRKQHNETKQKKQQHI